MQRGMSDRPFNTAKRNAKRREILAFIIVFLVTFSIGLGSALLGGPSITDLIPPIPVPLWLSLPIGIAALAIAMIVHEAGHLVGGALSGFQFRLISIGPLRIARRPDGRPALERNRTLNVAGGATVVAPKIGYTTAEMARFIVGGPLASLMFGIIGLVVAYRLETYPLLAFIWFAVGSLSSLIFMVNVLPISSSGFDSDGMQLFDLFRGGSLSHAKLAALNVIAESTNGVRPRDLSEEPLKTLLAHETGRAAKFTWIGQLITFARMLDLDRADDARGYLDLLLENPIVPAYARRSIAGEALFYFAYYRRDRDAARRYEYDFRARGLMEPQTRHRVEAALALIDGRTEEALAHARKGLAAVPRSVDPGHAVQERELLEAIRTEAEALRSESIDDRDS